MRDEQGSVSAELLLLLPVLLLLVLGGLEMARAASLRMALGDGAWRAARYLSVIDPWDESTAVQMIREAVSRNVLGGDPQAVQVAIGDDGGRSFGHRITVTARASFCPLVPFLVPKCVTLEASHTQMVEAWP